MVNGIIKGMKLPRGLKLRARGFTLVELIVALTIMIVMTVVMLQNYPGATRRITLLNNTNTLALTIREAQLRGSAIDSITGSTTGYGVFIDLATSSDMIFFNDDASTTIVSPNGLSVGDGVYHMDKDKEQDETKTTTVLSYGYSYKKLCVASSTASAGIAPYGFLCNATSSPPIRTLDISFTRPSSLAHIHVNGSTTDVNTSACIELYSPESPKAGHIRSVQVYYSGVVTTLAQACD